MATAKRKKESPRPNSINRKSAMDKLLDTMRNIIEDGACDMTAKELKESERKFHAIADRVAARKQRREAVSSKPQPAEP
jgi:hypothetical protein